MRTCSIILALALSGCATTQTITAPCISQADYSKLAAAEPEKVKDKLIGQADADIRPITASAIELRAWGEGLLGALHICATDAGEPSH